MFTGLVEETGRVVEIMPSKKSIRLSVASKICAAGLRTGDSLAVNGCCLTVVGIKRARAESHLSFDLLGETWKLTNLRFAKTAARVNLERPLRADSRLGGHFVTGHIDGLGKIIQWEKSGADHFLEIEAPASVSKYVISKGSIAVDGISLTVAAARGKRFSVWIIPHTFKATALQERRVGDAVNLEADLLGKYVEKFVREVP